MDSAGNVHIADTGDNRLRKVAPGGAHNGAGSALCGHRPRVRQFRQSLHRRVHCLSPLPHDARWDHHALRRHEFQYRVGGPPCRRLRRSWTIPSPLAVDRFGTVYVADLAGELQRITSNCPLSSPYFDAVPGVASDAQGNINFSDPQHGIVWRLPAAPPPSRGSLQFRFVSADYPTAGQKRRLTTRHRP